MVRVKSYEGLGAMSSTAIALLKEAGIVELLDSRIVPDEQRILTPGNATALMVGALYKGMGRRALYKLDEDYATAPLDLICGPGIKAEHLNARAFSRALDDLYELDLPSLTFEIYEILRKKYGIVAVIYNMDSTNFGVSAVIVVRDKDGAAIPEWNGHAKDGDNSRKVYNLQTVTDNNGIVCFERPYDGSVSDSEMDRDTVEFLSTRLDPKISTIVADSKMVTMPLIRLLIEKGFGFVSKCPVRFGSKAKEKVKQKSEGRMQPSGYAKDWEVFDTDLQVEEDLDLRFVAFRTAEGTEPGVEFQRTMGLKRVKERFSKFTKTEFACQTDAMNAFNAALEALGPTAYDITGELIVGQRKEKYGKRGRPPKDWVPRIVPYYMVGISWDFNERRAEEMSSDRELRVLVTNLPRVPQGPRGGSDNPRDGATADDVLRIFMGQYRVEHAFRTSKSDFDVDTVYLHKPSRENAFLFVLSLATMTAGLINAVLKKKGILRTAAGMINDFSTLIVEYDRADDEIELSGSQLHANEFLACIEALGLDPDRLLH